jgi:hypothetical protein
LAEAIDEVLPSALRQASLEAFEGRYDDAELAGQIDAARLKETALALVSETATTHD